MTKQVARAHARKSPRRRLRLCKTEGARSALAAFGKETEVDCLTFGQFSIMDAIEAILEITGPAHVAVATWTAATADVRRCANQLKNGNILGFRLIVDGSFVTRQPAYAAAVREMFGAESIRVTRTHAKFALITNEKWNVCVRTSMNLNENPRLEFIQVSDDADLCGFYLGIVDELFSEVLPGLSADQRRPELASYGSGATPIRAGKVSASGPAKGGP